MCKETELDFGDVVINAGFIHTAFAFGNEAGINKNSIDGMLVPIGALIRLVQKGLQYLEMEANLTNVSILYFNTSFYYQNNINVFE